jgi:HEAT repeat protein
MSAFLLAVASALSLFSAISEPAKTFKSQIMTHAYFSMTYGVVPDFDSQPDFFPHERLALASFLASADAETRKAGVQFFWMYVLLKRQYQPDREFKRLAQETKESLGRYQKSVIAGLEGALLDSDRAIQVTAASTLLALEPEHIKARESLGAFAKFKEGDGTLLAFGSPKVVVPLLRQLLEDKDASVRTAALQGVLLRGKQVKETAPKIAAMLVSEDAAIMGDVPIIGVIRLPVSEDLAYQCLTKMGSEARDALPVFLRAAKKNPKTAPPKVLHLLGMVGEGSKDAIDVLREALQSDTPDVRMHAASGLLLAKPNDSEALKYLKDSLKSEEQYVQKAAVEALARVGPGAEPMVEGIVKILEDTANEDRLIEIAQTLASIRTGEKRAVLDLEALLQKERETNLNPNSNTQEFTFHLAEALAFALAKQGDEGEKALVRVLQDTDARYREYAAAALGAFGEKASDETVKALVKELEAQNIFTQRQVIAALGSIGPKAKKAAPELRRLLEMPFSQDPKQEEYEIKILAGWALKRVSG